ncbi:MAG: hypothetical protein WBC73_19555 [Phormidesmis sp.]
MCIFSFEGAAASTFAAAMPPSGHFPAGGQPTPPREQVRHLLFGTPAAVHSTIGLLHKLGYAEPNDWSRPIPTGKSGEVMATLMKRVGGE